MTPQPFGRRHSHPLTILFLIVSVTGVAIGQTKVVAPKNRYSVAEDVKLGREAAAQAKKELPMLNDERVDDYVERIGARLATAVPPEFTHPEFNYTFDVVNQKEINAFALPGGPMFLNRGMIESAKTEGEVAGVMGHEMAHVALRHGTAQASSGQGAQIGGVVGQILGGIIGGTAGSIISTGAQLGAGAYITKYSRQYESQADLLGAQMLARAGYDPREMANMFKTLAAEGGSRGPEWLSSHPNPGNRAEAILKEARSLQVQGNGNSGQFSSIQARLSSMPPAYTAEQIAKGQARSSPGGSTASRAPVNVPPPSMQFRSTRPLNFLRLNVPSNWQEVSGDDDGVTFAPEGGYVETQSGSEFTHGLQLGITKTGSGNLQRDTDQLIAAFAKSNPQLRSSGRYSREEIGGRPGLSTVLSNSSPNGEREAVSLATTQLSDGRLLFIIGVAPQKEASAYDDAFRRVRQSIQIADR